MQPPRLLAAALLLALSAGGCATNSRVTALEQRIIQLEKDRAALRLTTQRDQKRMRRLRDEIESSSTFLRRNGARMTARLDDLEDAVRRQKGASEVLAHRLSQTSRLVKADHAALEKTTARLRRLTADLRDRAGISILALPRELPEHADDWVKLADERFGWGEVRVADAIAKECRKRFRGTRQAGRCGLIQGKIAYEEHRFGDAITTFRAVHDQLDGKPLPEVADALLGIARTFEAEGKCKQARDVLGYVKQLMKRRPQVATKAAKLLRSQRSRCREGKVALPTRTSGALKRAAEEKKKAEEAAQKAAEAKARAEAEARRKAEEAAIRKARAERDARAKAEAEAEAKAAKARKDAAPKGDGASGKDAAPKDAAPKGDAAPGKATAPKGAAADEAATPKSAATAKKSATAKKTEAAAPAAKKAAPAGKTAPQGSPKPAEKPAEKPTKKPAEKPAADAKPADGAKPSP